jgi:CBS domain-containing protein
MRLLADVMTHPVTVVPDTMAARDCAVIMAERDVRHLPVVDGNGRCTGLLTDHELRRRSMWVDVGFEGATAKQLQRDVQVTLGPSIPVSEALIQLHAHTQDAVVVAREDGVPVGIFTEHDAMGIAARELPNRPLPGVPDELPILDADTSALDARSWMARERLLHAMLVRGGRLVGVLSFRDVALEDDLEEHLTAADVASRPVASHQRLSARTLASLLHSRKIGCLPVVDDAWRPVDFTTRRDLMRALAHELS